MNIINQKKNFIHSIIIILLFILYVVIILLSKEFILSLLNNIFSTHYNFYSKAFAASVFFPFLIMVTLYFILLQHYFGKIRSFKFDNNKLILSGNSTTIIKKVQILKITLVEKERYIMAIKFMTLNNKYSIYHPAEEFIEEAKTYYDLKNEDKIDFDQNSKETKRHYWLNQKL